MLLTSTHSTLPLYSLFLLLNSFPPALDEPPTPTLFSSTGVALNFHSYQMALLLAVSLGRTLVVDSSEAAQKPSDSDACVLETLETLFEPLSGCKYEAPGAGDEVTLTWQEAMVTSAEAAQKRVVRLETPVPTPSGFVDRGESWVELTWWEGFLENLIAAGELL